MFTVLLTAVFVPVWLWTEIVCAPRLIGVPPQFVPSAQRRDPGMINESDKPSVVGADNPAFIVLPSRRILLLSKRNPEPMMVTLPPISTDVGSIEEMTGAVDELDEDPIGSPVDGSIAVVV